MELRDLPIKYIEGNGSDFVIFIQNKKDKARLESIDGHARWVVTEDDGSEVVYRPIEAKPDEA